MSRWEFTNIYWAIVDKGPIWNVAEPKWNKNEGQNMDGVYESKSGIFLLYFNNTLDCRT